jgi:hypothetical protein
MENEKQDGPKTFKVPEENLPTLRDRIAKLNKKATKLNCAAIAIEIIRTFEVPIKERDFDGMMTDRVIGHRKFFELTVSGAAPKINGWEFIAVVQPTFDEEGKQLGNMLRGVPGASCEVPVEYRSATSACDHCKTSRRRNDTFILHSDAGETKQVGRQCLRDFLGHTSPEVLCSIAQMLMDAEDFASDSERDEFGSRHQVRYFNAEEVLALAACSVRLNGWRSNKTAHEFGSLSTSGEVGNWIFASNEDRKAWEKPLKPSDEDKATAHEVAEWLATLSARPELNDYMYNLSVIGAGATFTTKNFGIACSAIPTYLREMEREINRRKKFEADLSSQYVGEVGKRETFTATLVYTTDLESQFGVTHLYKFKDEAGNILVWFASSVFYNVAEGRDIDLGDTVKFDATVKNHEEYKGIKQTMISRAVWWVSKEEKKAAAKARKAERDEKQAEEDRIRAINPNYWNAYHPDYGKESTEGQKAIEETLARSAAEVAAAQKGLAGNA